MKLELPLPELDRLVTRQIDHLFGFRRAGEKALLKKCIRKALKRCEGSFGRVRNKYYQKNGRTFFNPFHTGQYATFLYFLSRAVHGAGPSARSLADRIYALNKALHAVDLFYEVELPDIFFTDHPLGTVMGRARYGDHFAFAQNCTVGNNRGFYPVIGRNVRMLAGSKILGKCRIGDHVTLAADACVKDTDIPSGSVVFGQSPRLTIKRRPKGYFTGPDGCFLLSTYDIQ